MSGTEKAASSVPSGRCPLGSLGLHTLNYQRDECIWCGPNHLAWKPGEWVTLRDGTSAWLAAPADTDSSVSP